MRRAVVANGGAGKRRVLFYVEGHLPPSQSFVAQQARTLRRYEAEMLAGRRVNSPSAAIGTYPVHDISGSPRMRLGELLLKLPRVPMPSLFPAVVRADIVHAHFGKNGYVIGPLAQAARKPLVTTFHGFDATFAGDPASAGGFNQVRYFARGRGEMAAWSAWSVAVSDFIRNRLIGLGYPRERVVRHYIGIDTDLFRPRAMARHPYRVVSVARFVDYKGHRLMIDALCEVAANTRLPIEFVMVGEGPLRHEIEAYARARLPHSLVRSRLSQGEIVDLLAGARLYLHGSVTLPNGHAEALGLANLEAQAVGTPAVAFDSGGVGEAIEHERTGLVVPERDVRAMATAVASLLTDSDKWAAQSAAAAEMVPRRFSIAAQAPLLEDLYDEVLASATSGDTSLARAA